MPARCKPDLPPPHIPIRITQPAAHAISWSMIRRVLGGSGVVRRSKTEGRRVTSAAVQRLRDKVIPREALNRRMSKEETLSQDRFRLNDLNSEFDVRRAKFCGLDLSAKAKSL